MSATRQSEDYTVSYEISPPEISK